MTLTPGEIRRRRLGNQRLAGPPWASATEVVGGLGALQSQEFAVAKWSIAQRARGLGDRDLDRAFAGGALLRTHLLRPTWHFVLPADIRWMIELTAPRVHAMNAYYYRKFELDSAVLARSRALMARALADGRQRTRQDLAEALGKAGIVADGLRLGYLLMHAELERFLCSGAPQGTQQTYALFDERVPPSRPRPRDEALAELTRRYFATRGPATLKDFLWWSSLTAGEARRGLEMAGAQLERQVVGERVYWLTAAPPPRKTASPSVHLLQGYDEYVIAYRESKDVLNGSGTAATFTHAIVLDGQVVGHWRRAAKKGASLAPIEAHLTRRLDAGQQRALEAAVGRYRRFLEA